MAFLSKYINFGFRIAWNKMELVNSRQMHIKKVSLHIRKTGKLFCMYKDFKFTKSQLHYLTVDFTIYNELHCATFIEKPDGIMLLGHSNSVV